MRASGIVSWEMRTSRDHKNLAKSSMVYGHSRTWKTQKCYKLSQRPLKIHLSTLSSLRKRVGEITSTESLFAPCSEILTLTK